MTTAAQGHHVVILLQNHVLLIVKVQQAHGLERVGHAARRLHVIASDLERVHDRAHRGVVRGSDAHPQREGAGARAVVGVVAAGGDDPARPADLFEVHEQGNALAALVHGREPGRRARLPSAVVAVVLGGGRFGLGLSCDESRLGNHN